MAIRLEVVTKVTDTRALIRKNSFNSLLKKGKIDAVDIIDVYTIDKKFTPKELQAIGHMLANPVTQEINTSQLKNKKESKLWAIEIGYLPGVTDNIAQTAMEEIEDLLSVKFKPGEQVYSSVITVVYGKISKNEIEMLTQSLYNPLIQRAYIKDSLEKLETIIPKVKLQGTPSVSLVDLSVSDEELAEIGKNGIKNNDGLRRGPLALDLLYMKAIQAYFKSKKRKPTDIELESIAQTWSEHCKHTIFADPIDNIQKGLYKTYIKGATEKIRKEKGKKDFCVSVFTDNSGAIEFDEKYLITHKVETHNSPSALDPFGGAVTGIVGVNRDAIGFGMGAKPVINVYGFCVGLPDDTRVLYKDKKLTQEMLLPKRILEGVVAGVNYGGNCSGIPTPQGFVYFDDTYRGKPLVFAGTVGLIPKKVKGKVAHHKKAQNGDYIVMVGGRVGKDGIHGATFSSATLDSKSPATAVQIGDPITQKKLSDVLIKEVRDLGLYNSITDNGAGGLSCSVAEMSRESNGCRISLDSVPLKYPGLQPWEIWISESQERMTLAVPKKNWKKFKKIMDLRFVEATILGTFTNSKKCIVTYKGQEIVNLDLDFLHDGLPQKMQKTDYTPDAVKLTPVPKISLQQVLSSFMEHVNLSSTEYIVGQYDHEVQSGSVLKPFQGKGRVLSDASVTRPVLSSFRGVVLSQALYPSYSEQDSYAMAACSIDTAIRNAVASGANIDHLALLDNFCWCSSTDPRRLGQLKVAVKACYDYATVFKTPFISGKDSMFNDFKGFDSNKRDIKISISPTLLISAIGVIKDSTSVVSLDFKSPGDLIYLLGETHNELGGSEFLRYIRQNSKRDLVGKVPYVDALKNINLYKKLYTCIQKNLVASSISLHHGGLANAFFRSAIGGMMGAEVSLKDIPGSTHDESALLFSESQGRILVSINPQNKDTFEKIMKGIPFKKIGKVIKEGNIIIHSQNRKILFESSVANLEKSYKRRFKAY